MGDTTEGGGAEEGGGVFFSFVTGGLRFALFTGGVVGLDRLKPLSLFVVHFRRSSFASSSKCQ